MGYGSIVIVHVTTVGAATFVTVRDVSHPVAAVLSPVPVVLSQLMVADVSVDPPSRKLTWMSESGALVKVAVAAAAGLGLVQLVPLATVTATLAWVASP